MAKCTLCILGFILFYHSSIRSICFSTLHTCTMPVVFFANFLVFFSYCWILLLFLFSFCLHIFFVSIFCISTDYCLKYGFHSTFPPNCMHYRTDSCNNSFFLRVFFTLLGKFQGFSVPAIRLQLLLLFFFFILRLSFSLFLSQSLFCSHFVVV